MTISFRNSSTAILLVALCFCFGVIASITVGCSETKQQTAKTESPKTKSSEDKKSPEKLGSSAPNETRPGQISHDDTGKPGNPKAAAVDEKARKAQAQKHLSKANDLAQNGKSKEALREYTLAIEANPSLSQAFFNRGMCWGKLGDYRNAVQDYSKAIDLSPNYSKAIRNRALAWEKLGASAKARDDFARLVELDPKDVQILKHLGYIETKLRNYRSSIEIHTRALALDAKDPWLWNGRAVAHDWLGDHNQAIEDYTNAIQADPSFGMAFRNRGNLRLRTGARGLALTDSITADLLELTKREGGNQVKEIPVENLLTELDGALEVGHEVDIVVSARLWSDQSCLHAFVRDQNSETRQFWKCIMHGTGVAGEFRAWLRYHAAEIRLAQIGLPNESEFFKYQTCFKLTFRPAANKSFPVSVDKNLVLSPHSLDHFTIKRVSDYPAKRYAIIIGEAHDNLEQQFGILQGLEGLFQDNPWLKDPNGTAFLTEAWPAEKPLSIAPLVEYESKPNDDTIYRGLASWLITGYIAFEWKHQLGIPFIGHEDPEFYRLSNYLHWSIPKGIHAGKQLEKAKKLNGNFVLGRNAASGKTLVNSLKKYLCPILFIGYGHVGPYRDDAEWVARSENPPEDAKPYFKIEELDGIVPPTQLRRLSQTSPQSVASYLKQEKIGFIFLMPRLDTSRDRKQASKQSEEYLLLRQAQHEGKTDHFIQTLSSAGSMCTVAPSPKDAVKLLSSGYQSGTVAPTGRRLRHLLSQLESLFKVALPDLHLAFSEKSELRTEARELRKQVEEMLLRRGASKSDAEYVGRRASKDFLEKWNGDLKLNPVVMQDHVVSVVQEAARILGVDLDRLDVEVAYQAENEPDPRLNTPGNSDGASYFLPVGSKRIVVMGSNDLKLSRAMQLSVACHELVHVLQYNDFLKSNQGTADPAELWAWQVRFGSGEKPIPAAYVAYAQRERNAELRAARAVRSYFADKSAYRQRVFRAATEYSQSYRKGIQEIQKD